MQMARLFDQLVEAHAALRGQPPRLEPACAAVTDVGSKLSYEPGLTDIRDVWQPMYSATEALLAVCGQATLLEQPFDPTPATLQARARWQRGLELELQSACAGLRSASEALQHSRVDC
jgi:hypothetical protein